MGINMAYFINRSFFHSVFNRLVLGFFTMVFVAASCKSSDSSENKTPSSQAQQVQVTEPDYFSIEQPRNNLTFKAGEIVEIRIQSLDSSQVADSVRFYIDGWYKGSLTSGKTNFTWNSSGTKLGVKNIEAIGYFKNNLQQHQHVKVVILSGQLPVLYTYSVVNTYPHDKEAFTQGLIYENGFLYEGTGLEGKSTLRKEKLITGELVKAYTLPSDVFGEGIATFDNRIVQITWKSQVAFVFDKESFQLLAKHYYPMKEGWGLTYDGTSLIMSDGSSVIYFLDKEYFAETSRIEVYDNEGPVKNLNELEYINGEIWANIFTTDTIVRINPATGAVTGKIDLAGLLKDSDRDSNTDVLNGIAYDKDNNRIFVTGKNWPKLFQITLRKK